MYTENTLETIAVVGTSSAYKIGQLVEGFIRYIKFELSLSPQTAEKYQDALGWVIRDIGDIEVTQINQNHITLLKQRMMIRGAGEARVGTIIFALKSFLKYCREFLELEVLDNKKIKSPKRHRREVLFLTPEEIQQFISTIKLERSWNGGTREKTYRMEGLRFRTLVEVLLGTAMRISEALSLNRDSIDFEKKEAKIIGKGNKERTVFFSDRSLEWVRLYLAERKDEEKPLFITQRLSRMSRVDIHGLFKRYVIKSGINKKITPHILRHTAATTLLFNGCPISHVKEILGHERLETTCKYYLGVDKRKAKEAHELFLNY